VAGVNEYVGFAASGWHAIRASTFSLETGGMLQRSDGGGSDGYHAPVVGSRAVDRFGCPRRNLIALSMQLVVFHFFYSYGLKGS
jgi:hypothetical protein